VTVLDLFKGFLVLFSLLCLFLFPSHFCSSSRLLAIRIAAPLGAAWGLNFPLAQIATSGSCNLHHPSTSE
jgi:hypothetical protein